MLLLNQLDAKVKAQGGLIVSCQPVPQSPMDKPEIIAAMALAAEQAGAVALRIEGIANLRAVRALVSVPVIGIVKRDLPDFPVRITPWLEDVDALAEAGASIIAFDGTQRLRPVPIDALLARIRQHQLIAMADCASLEEGLYCHQQGAELIGTTLSGYTSEVTPTAPDLALVASLSQAGCRVVAEGRYNSPALAAQAIGQGAWTVTVGSAITRLEHICAWYRDALQRAIK
ncbi:N-acetylmannosamine-6-phosphate 2-epimerase [Leclercia adecarboxylata]|uniref:N-acetylmannosamine-6-phosphate 2-epimerase n=1 Tax=Leclercia adecarboxylata TaxID=83655 RepID=UPI002DBCF9A1|nr:N-acetylmannosamine-6-phosphate 2-epimerase [Leclercia adecarboxylata]MEB6380095.1 N-acetylmannosamine-6-phosphate 2-epimerase [Leclercia adecarboxylata]